ncbi:MAG TPA: hypothetical protein VH063_08870 [Gaiellaceae bacterium]|jgi:uncharacterized integral membrane protein|nr:hypothetical protein [Gaiellaceae bacterium]
MAEAPKVEVVKQPSPRQVHKLEGGRLVLVVVVVLYVLLFIAFNTRRVEVNFVFFSIRSQLLIAFGIIAILSFGAGFFVAGRVGAGHRGFLSRTPQNRP